MKNAGKNISTVMVTDIVGYSKLTGDNQELALELLSEHDKIILESIEIFNGNVLVNRGDGFVVMFTLPSDAVLCSMDIQNKIKIRNKFNIQSRLFRIRIWIHTGKYSRDGDDYYGECIDGASTLEPLAPYGGILISSYSNSLLELEDNIYTREYDKIILNKNTQIAYNVYLNLLDWYKNKKRKKIHNINEDKYIELAHSLYKQGNYSGSIKFANSVLENTNDKEIKFNILSFLCNSFIALGQLNESEALLKEVTSKLPKNVDLELKGHLLKLEGHLFFNNEKWEKASLVFKKSYDILNSIESHYKNEVLFYFYLNLFFSNNLENKDLIIDKKLIEDEYKILIDCLLLFVNNKTINRNLLYKINHIEKDQLKSYAFWILSKYYGRNNMIDESYKYDTKSQETLQRSSQNLSDTILRDQFLKNLILHTKILSETSVQIDDLIDIPDVIENKDTESSIIYNNELIFNYCVSCGEENINNNIECPSCSTNLSQSFYE